MNLRASLDDPNVIPLPAQRITRTKILGGLHQRISVTCCMPCASTKRTTTATALTKRWNRPHHGRYHTITDPQQIASLDVRRHDRLGGIVHEYQHAA